MTEEIITPKISALRLGITLGLPGLLELLGLLPDYPDYRSDNPAYCRNTRITVKLLG